MAKLKKKKKKNLVYTHSCLSQYAHLGPGHGRAVTEQIKEREVAVDDGGRKKGYRPEKKYKCISQKKKRKKKAGYCPSLRS